MARRGGLSILERNQRVIGLIALALILTLTTLALLLQGGLLTPSYTVSAVFEDAAGITSDDDVTVAGLPAGRVKDLVIEGGRVTIELAVNRDVELPADTRAEIVVETLLGQRSVALLPHGESGTLADGDVIPLERTTTPITVTELNDISVRLLEASDADAFESFLLDVSEITEGKADDVRDLITGLERVTRAVDERGAELARLLESLRTLASTFGQRDQTIASLIDNLDAVLGDLAERKGDLELLLHATDRASHETADLVRRNRGELDATLENLRTTLQVLDRHQLDLAAGIAYLNQAVEGYSSVGYSGCKPVNTGCTPNRWANIFVQSLGPLGVDALLGKCGLVDQLFDKVFGADCEQAGDGGAAEGGRGAARASDGPPDAEPSAAEVPDEEPLPPALPCTIEALVGSALEGTRTAARIEGCEGP